jgi:hypothetical protein
MLGLTEDIGMPFPMRPTAQERIGVGIPCGAVATIGVSYVVRFAPPYLSTFPIMQISRNATDVAYQTPCAPPTTTSGQGSGGDTENGDTVYLCWYEVWYDSFGRVVSYVELSCEKLGGNEF